MPMPELPDIVIYLERLAPLVVGQPLQRLLIGNPFVLRSVSPALGEIEGHSVVELRRLGKRIVLGLEGERFLVRLALDGYDRRGLYADVAAAVSSTGTDIRSMELKSLDGRMSGSALVEVENLDHLQKIMKALRRVKGISEVARRERVTTEE